MPSFTLPDHVTIDAERLQAIAKRHGLDGTTIEHLPDTGIIHSVYRIGQEPMLLEIPRFFLGPPGDRWRAVGPIEHVGLTSSVGLARIGGAARV